MGWAASCAKPARPVAPRGLCSSLRTRIGPMDALTQALRGAAQNAPVPLRRLQSALVVGAGGTLGSAVLAEGPGGGPLPARCVPS